MIVLFTDFGLEGPYVGQMKAVLQAGAPGVPVIDLFADAPTHDPRAAAYLLPAYAAGFPADAVFLCVVDPGVGGDRTPAMVMADGHWFVGPENGLFAMIARRAVDVRWWPIDWRPDRLSASFHGRDLFAPTAARLACGQTPTEPPQPASALDRPDWPDDLAEIVYFDRFGNAMTGLRASEVPADALLEVAGRRLQRARIFSDVPEGTAFWYENANGLAEIAVNRGRAADVLNLDLGAEVGIAT